ncbi:MAG: DNA repair protein RecO, partial [Deltaproteobacteria bacterium]|nr:DNA repair protein RecO [Deltaproteobacteria bacterium]
TIDYAEYDRIVSLYTKDYGRIRGIAKGAKRSQKRFGGTLEPFTHNEVTFIDKETQGLNRLERCRLLTAFPELAHDIRKVTCGTYFLELVNLLTPEKEKNAEIFTMLLFFIGLLRQHSFREELMRIFELRLFTLLGYQPQLQTCTACGSPFSIKAQYGFSIKRGGLVCGPCIGQQTELMALSNGTIKIMQQAQSITLEKVSRIRFSEAAHTECKNVLKNFLEYHIGKKPKSLAVLEQLR